jgi:hypothetical protein
VADCLSPIVITNCSGRKRGNKAGPIAQVRTDSVIDWFQKELIGKQTDFAAQLYAGRSFQLAMKAAQQLSTAEFMIVSAGLGLVSDRTQIPRYEATVSGSGSIAKRFDKEPHEWWRILQSESPYACPWPSSDRLLLVAVSSQYLQLIAEDLSGHPIENLRIFTRTNPESVPCSIRPALMPYGSRFDGPESPLPGTITDFASRTLFHFIQSILRTAPGATLREHKEMVNALAEQWPPQSRRAGRTATDAEIIAIIADHAENVSWKASAMLRVLRGQLSIACEQKRFSKLFRMALATRRESECLVL